MTRMTNILAASAIAAAASLSHQAIGAEKTDGLPGVQGGRTIVQPAAEPEMPVQAESPYGPGFVKVGDSWVRISGRVRYDVDFSAGKTAGAKSKK